MTFLTKAFSPVSSISQALFQEDEHLHFNVVPRVAVDRSITNKTSLSGKRRGLVPRGVFLTRAFTLSASDESGKSFEINVSTAASVETSLDDEVTDGVSTRVPLSDGVEDEMGGKSVTRDVDLSVDDRLAVSVEAEGLAVGAVEPSVCDRSADDGSKRVSLSDVTKALVGDPAGTRGRDCVGDVRPVSDSISKDCGRLRAACFRE